MTERVAACSCGRLTARTSAEPLRLSICHCRACQRRTGSAFGAQARFPRDQVRIEGPFVRWERVAESGNTVASHFCPTCGATLFLAIAGASEVVAIPVGAFADAAFPPPRVSVWEETRHPWVGLPDGMEHVG